MQCMPDIWIQAPNQVQVQIFRAILVALYILIRVTLRFESFPESCVVHENNAPQQNYLLVDNIFKKTSSECGSRVTSIIQVSQAGQHYATMVSRVLKGAQSHISNKKILPRQQNYLLVDNTLKRIYSECGFCVTTIKQVSPEGQYYATTSYLNAFLKTRVESLSHRVYQAIRTSLAVPDTKYK